MNLHMCTNCEAVDKLHEESVGEADGRVPCAISVTSLLDHGMGHEHGLSECSLSTPTVTNY